MKLGRVTLKENDLLIGVRFAFYIPDKLDGIVWVSPAIFKLISDNPTPSNLIIQNLIVKSMPINEDKSHKYSSLEDWIEAIIDGGEDILCKTSKEGEEE